MKGCILALIALLAPASLEAITFEKWYGGPQTDVGYCVRQTSDGGYVIAGATNKQSFLFPNWDVLLLKVNSVGRTEWTKTYGDSLEDRARCVQECTNRGYIVVGSTYTEEHGNRTSDVYLLRVDSDGDTIWTRTYGGAGWDEGHSIIRSGGDAYVIIGSTTSYGGGGADVCLLKVNAIGDTIWTSTWGGSSADVGESVSQTDDGGYILTGWSISASPDSGGAFLVKTDSVGCVMWEKFYGGDIFGAAYSVQQTRDGGYVACGHNADFGNGGWEVWLLRTNSLGDTLWTKSYGGYSEDWGYSVQETSDAGYIIAGHTWSYGGGSRDVYLIKTDKMGNRLWTRTYGGVEGDGGRSVQITNDGGYVVVGSTESFGSGGSDVYLIKTDSAGVVRGSGEGCYSELIVEEVVPNPSAGETRTYYGVSRDAHVRIIVYNSLGHRVRTLLDEHQPAGFYTAVWDATDSSGRKVPSGTYFLRLRAGESAATRKLCVVR